ncbi:MAG: GFA family protein [Myxococcota bacterium]
MSDSVRLEGGCHCGAVRIAIEWEGPRVALGCNCSICRRTGYLHAIVPRSRFELIQGEEHLVDYRFGTGAARHRFCRICGIKCFYEPRSHPGQRSVHVGCLDEGPKNWEIQPFDGENWEDAFALLDAPPDRVS